MTYEDIITLGWKDRWANQKRRPRQTQHTFIFDDPGFDYHIMSVCFDVEYPDGSLFHSIMIKLVPLGTKKNIWENSECHFFGDIKTIQELHLIMQFLGIIDYTGIK